VAIVQVAIVLSPRRPADVLIQSWTRGRDAVLDVTVVTLLQKAFIKQAADQRSSRNFDFMGVYKSLPESGM
jgi:hypothetical protein